MKLAAAFESVGEHIAIELPGARAVFTTRRGGFSSGPFESLNLGRWTEDDPELVARNRTALERELGLELRFTRQVHRADVVRIESPGRDHPLQEADGQATAVPGLGLAVLVADCLPVALAAEGAVAIVHAGWRGLAAGVIEEGVRAVRELGGTGPLEAAIGPGAGPCCYEVGEEVHEVFADKFPQAWRGDNLDLKSIARSRLEQAGVDAVHDVGLCTICSSPELFYSHRRDNGVTGRQAGVAWLS